MNVTTVGIDLAKLIFQVLGVDGHGKAMIRKQLKRAELMRFFANLPACLIGMEACSSAHVPIKNVEQQVLLGIHRARQGFVQKALRDKYGLLMGFTDVMATMTGRIRRRAYIEIELADS